MTLKSAKLARAENLPEKIRSELKIDKGLIIIETRNPTLRDEYKPITDGGIREYLLSLGDFKNIDITE